MKTSQLFEVVENGEILKLDNTDSSKYKGGMNLDYLSNDCDGIFPAGDNWVKFAGNVDIYGASFILDEFFFGEDSLENQLDGYIVKRETTYDNNITIIFDEPIEMVVGVYEENGEWVDITKDIDFIKGEIAYEWLWDSNNNRASAIDINLNVTNYGKIKGTK